MRPNLAPLLLPCKLRPLLLPSTLRALLRRPLWRLLRRSPGSHVKGDERERQEQFVEQMQRQYARVYESRASISYLTAHALFTVTLNGAAR